jgi:hypothetical protein
MFVRRDGGTRLNISPLQEIECCQKEQAIYYVKIDLKRRLGTAFRPLT